MHQLPRSESTLSSIAPPPRLPLKKAGIRHRDAFDMSTSNVLSLFSVPATSQPTCPVTGGGDPTARSFLSATLSRVDSSQMSGPTATGFTGDRGGVHEHSRFTGGAPPFVGSMDLISVPIHVFTKRNQEGQVETFPGKLIIHENAKGVYADLPHGPTILVRMPSYETPQPIDPSLVCAISFFSVADSVLYGASVPDGISYRVAGRIEESATGISFTIDLPPECAPINHANFAEPDDYLLAFLKCVNRVVNVAWWGATVWYFARFAGAMRIALIAPQEPRAHAD